MHSSRTLLALLAAAASVVSAQLPGQSLRHMAVVQNIVTVAMPPSDGLRRRSDDSCQKAAVSLASKFSAGLKPLQDPTFTSSLSSYLSAHPNVTTLPTSLAAEMCESSSKGLEPTITGPLGSQVTAMASSLETFWSSVTPDIQAMWAECSTVKGASALLGAIPTACGSIRADITGTAAAAKKAGAPKATAAIKAVLAVAGVAVVALN